MSESFEEIRNQISQLEEQLSVLREKAEQARERELSTVVADIRSRMDAYGITAEDLGLAMPSATALKHERKRKPVAVQFQGPNGETWTGRGKKPLWVGQAIAEGKTLEDFRVASTDRKRLPSQSAN